MRDTKPDQPDPVVALASADDIAQIARVSFLRMGSVTIGCIRYEIVPKVWRTLSERIAVEKLENGQFKLSVLLGGEDYHAFLGLGGGDIYQLAEVVGASAGIFARELMLTDQKDLEAAAARTLAIYASVR